MVGRARWSRLGTLGMVIVAGAILLGCTGEGPGAGDSETAAPVEPTRPPNIVVILADDLGYGDVSTYGGRVPTPNIDRIGKEGAIFEQGYVTTPVCSPSRAALLTGRYQQRFGFEYNARLTDEFPDLGLVPSELTMADHLKGAGYATGIVGKWHLGFQDEHYPTNRGFDEFYGHLAGATRYIDPKTAGAITMPTNREFRRRPAEDLRTDLVVRGSDPPSPPERQEHNAMRRGPEKTIVQEAGYITDVFGKEAVGFIERHRDQPFFLYAAFNAPHSPFEVTQEYYGRFPEVKNELQRIYFGMIAALDDAVGRILEALDENGLAENTLVVFLSDNGCAGYYPGLCSCEPLSGGKLTYYEGGVRVPYLMRWPRSIAAGTRIPVPVSTLDVLPTVLDAAGATPPADLELDGETLLPLLAGKGEPPHDRFVWRNYPTIAVRKGNLKLIKPNQDREGGFLYDLAADVREQHDLAGEQPEQVTALEAEIADWRTIATEPLWGHRPPVTYSICGIEPIGFEN